jgi:hypothetical protein
MRPLNSSKLQLVSFFLTISRRGSRLVSVALWLGEEILIQNTKENVLVREPESCMRGKRDEQTEDGVYEEERDQEQAVCSNTDHNPHFSNDILTFSPILLACISYTKEFHCDISIYVYNGPLSNSPIFPSPAVPLLPS